MRQEGDACAPSAEENRAAVSRLPPLLRLVLLLAAATLAMAPPTRPVATPVAAQIEALVASRGRGIPVHAVDSLRRLYGRRDHRPLWSEGGRPLGRAEELVEAVGRASEEGLLPDRYHLPELRRRLAAVREQALAPVAAAELDLLLSDAFLLLGCHYSAGCVNPVTVEAEWFARRGPVDVVRVLEQAVARGSIVAALAHLLPPQDRYGRMRQALARYRAIAHHGGWPALAPGPLLRLGSHGGQVAILRRRLLESGEAAGDLFDGRVEAAVRRFQARHGLANDGVVGPATRRALNVPATARARQIALNLERLRRSPRKQGRYLEVNIADYRLRLVEGGHTRLAMAVVVGRRFWHTPVFAEPMTYLVFNPAWTVPRSIATRDILPRLRRDSGWLMRHGFDVFHGYRKVAPDTIDWRGITVSHFPYALRQRPGPMNPLGRVKFIFPNRFHVYLHDTPATALFDARVRTFSHGCIRVARPLQLATALLGPAWDEARVVTAIATGRRQTVSLPQPVTVCLLYLTAWVDETGVLQFRDDIYGRDRRLAAALDRPPAPQGSPHGD